MRTWRATKALRAGCGVGLMLMLTSAQSSPAAAFSIMTGNMLWEDCQAGRSDPSYYQKAGRCYAYVVGTVDTLEMVAAFEGRAKCVPAGVTIGQLGDVVIAYLRANPQKRHLSGANLVALSINQAFGCAILPEMVAAQP